MSRSQLAVRIPQFLNEKLNSYVARTGASKTEVVVGALAHYLECTSDLPLSQRMAELEAKVATLEAQMKTK
ncbi:MAG: DNA-binding domain-containing protein [Xenococcaceae cyanobacterium]